MRILAIGDVHGRSHWKEIIANESFDKVIFVGDYFDSFNIGGESQIENFKDIIALKTALHNDCILLIGNHDVHYMNFWQERYSGFQKGYQYTISDVLHKNLDKLQMCYTQDNLCFTHAGITKTWAKKHYIDLNFLEKSINELWYYRPLSFMFQGKEPYGNDITQSPIWVRPESLREDAIEDYIHIVGHTTVKDISYLENVILIDCLENKNYLIHETV